MKVIERKPITMAEAKSLISDFEERKELQDYFKKFSKLSKEKSLALAEEIRGLDNIKIKEKDIIKIVEFLPKEVEEVHKIFTDVTLSEEEATQVVEIVKKY